MPATEVTPSMRRRLSDDARQLLRMAFHHGSPSSLHHLSLSQRLHNFRGKIRVEIPSVETTFYLRIVATETSYLLRCYAYETADGMETEISVLNKGGPCTSWMTTPNGQTIQLRTYLNDPMTLDTTKSQITTLLEILHKLDLFDVVHAAQTATEVSNQSIVQEHHALFTTMTDKTSYVFVLDRFSGTPLALTQTSFTGYRMHLVIEDYIRYDGTILVPLGIQSDVDLLIETAMFCFSQWSECGQRLFMQVFDMMDKDCDGYISSQDIVDHLLSVGQSLIQSHSIVKEMTRLLSDVSNPSEEMDFFHFSGFWISIFTESYHVSDPNNEKLVIQSFEKVFLGG